jgi:hypothetical protein
MRGPTCIVGSSWRQKRARDHRRVKMMAYRGACNSRAHTVFFILVMIALMVMGSSWIKGRERHAWSVRVGENTFLEHASEGFSGT